MSEETWVFEQQCHFTPFRNLRPSIVLLYLKPNVLSILCVKHLESLLLSSHMPVVSFQFCWVLQVYQNLLQAVLLIYKVEGPRSFFKGLSPTILQVAPHAGAQFATYTVFTRIWKDMSTFTTGLPTYFQLELNRVKLTL